MANSKSTPHGGLKRKAGPGGETHQIASSGDARLTTNHGVPVSDDQNSLKAGPRGPSLLEDFVLREKIQHFDHERIPERIVHARGSAAHGYFELTQSLAKYTRAKVLTEVGKRTEVFTRFSTVAGGAGSVDTPRDVRGFAVKLYTVEGNWDLVGNNIPVFFIQDAIKFPDLIHAVKMEADRGYPQAASAHDTFWDFIGLMPECTHMIMWAMSDRAIPRSLRMMEGFGVNTFRLVNDKDEADLRQVPLAAEARHAVDLLGRGGEDRRRRSGLPSPRPARGHRRRRLSRMGVRRPAAEPGRSRRPALRHPGRHQADPRGALSDPGGRPDGAGPQPGQLLRRDRAGGLPADQRAAGDRLLGGSAAAGPAVLLSGHPAVAAGNGELPPDPDQPGQGLPLPEPAARRAHADAGSQGPRQLRAQQPGRGRRGGRPARGSEGRVPHALRSGPTAARCGFAPRASPTTTARRGCSTGRRPRSSRRTWPAPSSSSCRNAASTTSARGCWPTCRTSIPTSPPGSPRA